MPEHNLSYCRIIQRLNGLEIEARFDYYLGLVEKGIAGFIIFGGELETVKSGLKELQKASKRPLIISSDLERGLGQHVNGGALFPPAMAVASAIRNIDKQGAALLLKRLFTAIALESGYAGINTIFAPVLDINTNPDNPIIATRAFGEDPETVSYIGCEMIRLLQENQVMACAKHFPGHGDTEIDSHLNLPVINKDLKALESLELMPFKRAIAIGVKMIMLGHLRVPAIEPSGLPVSLSARAVSYLRDVMGFKGLLITDAMDMGGLSEYSEDEASLMALKAGVDLILHPSDPDRTAAYLLRQNYLPQPLALDLPICNERLSIDFSGHKRLSDEIAKAAIKVQGDFKIRNPFLLMLNDDDNEKGMSFLTALRQRHPQISYCSVLPGEEIPLHKIPPDSGLIIAVFSEVRAWKGGTSLWLRKCLNELKDSASVFVSFGNPYILHNIEGKAAKVFAFCDYDAVQEDVAEKLISSI